MNNSGNAKGYGLKSISNSQVDSAIFYLGGREYDPSTKYGTTEDIYMWERGNITYNQNESERSKIWNGEIALIYPSDYLYAYSKEIDRNCYNYPNECYLNGKDKNGNEAWIYFDLDFDLDYFNSLSKIPTDISYLLFNSESFIKMPDEDKSMVLDFDLPCNREDDIYKKFSSLWISKIDDNEFGYSLICVGNWIFI